MIDTQTAPEITVDRGQPVIVTVIFGDRPEPEVVNFGYTKPGSGQPHVDDGYGQARSKIIRVDVGVYRYVFSTRDFEAGDAAWSFTGEWSHELPGGYDLVAIRGKYHVNEGARQLP